MHDFLCRMAEWLKKQSEREAEKEQRRLERIQRKLAGPKHQFTDPEYSQQCYELHERLEDSVLKGLTLSSYVVLSTQGPSDGPHLASHLAHLFHVVNRLTSSLWSGLGLCRGEIRKCRVARTGIRNV